MWLLQSKKDVLAVYCSKSTQVIKKIPARERRIQSKKTKLDQSASDQQVTDIDLPSTSAKKLGDNKENGVTSYDILVETSLHGIALVNMNLLWDLEMFICPSCNGNVKVPLKRLGSLTQQLLAECKKSGEKQGLSNHLAGKTLFDLLLLL